MAFGIDLISLLFNFLIYDVNFINLKININYYHIYNV